MTNVSIVFNRDEPILAFESRMDAAKYRSEKDFLDDDGIYKIRSVELIKREVNPDNPVKLIGVYPLPNKAIVIFADGSGASIIKRIDEHYFRFADDEENTPCTIEDIQDADYVFFVTLPDDFKVWG